MFQRIRELEGKLEVQKKHLKELEEKVGGALGPSPPTRRLPSVTVTVGPFPSGLQCYNARG